MRINKYRGKRSYDKKWIYGSLLIDNNGDFHILESNIIEKDGHHIYIDSDSPMFFDNDTIGQFTGLHDKNGVEIYEGDIVHIAIMGRFEKAIAEEDAIVVFENGRFGMHRGFDWHLTSFDSFCDTEFEVIGNIHEVEEDET